VDDADGIVCEARFSSAVGLSAALPDIQGLALRWYCQGELCDLLFAGTGLSRAGRFVLTPRRTLLAGPMTTLLPLRSANGPLLFAATPTPDAPPGADPEDLAEQATISPIVLTLAYATPPANGHLSVGYDSPGPMMLRAPIPWFGSPRWRRLRSGCSSTSSSPGCGGSPTPVPALASPAGPR